MQSKRVVTALFLTGLILVLAACASTGDGNNQPSQDQAQENGENSGNNKSAEGQLADSLFVYNGVKPGMTKQEVIDVLGEPVEKEDSQLRESITSWTYGKDFHVAFSDSSDKVITVLPPETSSGIKLGDSYQKVIEQYGEGARVQSRHTSDPSYFTLNYTKGENEKIHFIIGRDKVKIIEIGASLAD